MERQSCQLPKSKRDSSTAMDNVSGVCLCKQAVEKKLDEAQNDVLDQSLADRAKAKHDKRTATLAKESAGSAKETADLAKKETDSAKEAPSAPRDSDSALAAKFL